MIKGGFKMRKETKRKNIQLSIELAKWYEELADEIGISHSALMTMALKQYKDQQEALKFASNIEDLIEKGKTE